MTNLFMAAVGRVTDWASQNAGHYLYVAIPRERTDTAYDDTPLTPYKSYLRLWLSEMFLTKTRLWFREWCPAVHASVSLTYGAQPAVRFDKVASLPEELQSRGIVLNYSLSELMPYNGGIVEMTAGLLAIPMKQNAFLGTAIKVVGDFASLVAPPLGAALAVSRKVASGIEELMQVTGGQVHVGLHQSFNSEGGGGANNLRPGYLAIIMATSTEVSEDRLFVKGDRLHYQTDNAGGTKPLEGYDYMLFRVEGRKERDDWRLKDIQEPTDKAVQAWLKGNEEEARAFTLMALTAAYQSQDLAVHDRRRVIQAIKDELGEIQASGLALLSEENSSLNHIMEKQAIDVRQATLLPPISLAEALEGQFH